MKLKLLLVGQGQMTPSKKPIPAPVVTPHTRKFKSKTSQFLRRNYKTSRNFRGFEQLSCALGCRVMAEYVGTKMLLFVGLNGFSKSRNVCRLIAFCVNFVLILGLQILTVFVYFELVIPLCSV